MLRRLYSRRTAGTVRPFACIAAAALLGLTGRADAQCYPAASCAGALYCGGEWDFENGFNVVLHYLAGTCSGPCGDHEECISAVDSKSQEYIGVGWSHWASFPTWPVSGCYGKADFNANQNCANVQRGANSQEITMTCSNGVGVIYRTAAVPAGHLIRVEAEMKFTPNGTGWPPVEHSLGLDPTGGTNPEAGTVQWFPWDEAVASPPQPAGVFNHTSETIGTTGPQLTIMIRQLARQPPCQGQTFLIDNVKIFDDGPLTPLIAVQPATLTPSALVGTDAPAGAFTVRNSGALTLNYNITDNADWLSVNPISGSSVGEMDPIDVTYDTDALPPGTHNATITVTDAAAPNSPQTVAVQLTINKKPADLDGDGDADQSDFGLFQACYTGAGGAITLPACNDADLDHDDDVDGNDFGLFQACMSGPGVPSDPNCTNG